jgi:hypothetical protein
MPKPSRNNKISHPNVYGRIIQHDEWLNQGVQSSDSPTFTNLQVTGDTSIAGNLYVYGNASILDTNITEFEDNILVINRNESGAGVTLNQAGIEIERGTLENYRSVFDETTSSFRVGTLSELQAVATRQDVPLINGIMIWNADESRLDARDTIDIQTRLSDTTNATSTSGALTVQGGVSIGKDMYIGSTMTMRGTSANASLALQSNGSLNIVSQETTISTNNVLIPDGTRIGFGTTSTSIRGESSILKMVGTEIITDTTKLSIPTDAKFVLSGSVGNDFITSTLTGIQMTSSKDIVLSPSAGQKILVPEDTPIAFGSVSRQIYGGQNGDVSILASNNIHLMPGDGLDVRIPTSAFVKFGGSGNQKIGADPSDNLVVLATGDIQLTPDGKVVVQANTPLQLGNNDIIGNTSGISIDAPVGVTGMLDANGVRSTSIAIYIPDSGNVMSMNSTGILYVNSVQVSNQEATSANSLVELRTAFDSTPGYAIGRGTLSDNAGRSMVVRLPTVADYGSGLAPSFQLQSDKELFTIDSDGLTSISSTQPNALVVAGGLVASGIQSDKPIAFTGTHTSGISAGAAFNVDTVGQRVTTAFLDAAGARVSNTALSTDSSTGAFIVSGDASVQGLTRLNGAILSSSVNMGGFAITQLMMPTNNNDAATKAYVDNMSSGVAVKNSVIVATTTAGSLGDFIVGAQVDGHTLEALDRILIKDQIDPVENGIYIIDVDPPTRALDFDPPKRAAGAFVFSRQGSNANLGWICNTPSTADVIGTDPINFTQFTALGQVDAGNGLVKSFNTLDVNVDGYTLEIVADALRIASGAAGTGLTGGSGSALSTDTDQSHVTKVGTINAGTWQANVVNVLYGGTGRSRFTAGSILFGSGLDGLSTSSRFYFNSTMSQLGIGTGAPNNSLHILQAQNAGITIQADSDETFPNAYPELLLKHGSTITSSMRVARNANDFTSGVYSEALVVTNNAATQFVNGGQMRFTIASSGNIGINVTAPTHRLSVDGTMLLTGNALLSSTVNSTGQTNGALVVQGGLGVSKSAFIGESLTIQQDTSTNKLFVQSTVDATSTSGALIVEGGVLVNKGIRANDAYIYGESNVSTSIIRSTTNATSTSGALIVQGGVLVNKDLYANDVYTPRLILFSDNTLASISVTTGQFTINTFSNGNTLSPLDISISTNTVSLAKTVILDTTNATSTSGALVVEGGALVNKDLYVNGNTIMTNTTMDNIRSGITDTDILYHSNGGVFRNVEGILDTWYYLGPIEKGIIDFQGTSLFVDGTHATHKLSGPSAAAIVLFQDLSTNRHAFININATPASGTLIVRESDGTVGSLLVNEGTGLPDGSVSGYTTGWTLVYSTDSKSTLVESLGTLYANDTFGTGDSFPVLNKDASASTHTGALYELYPQDVVSGPATFSDALPDQTTAAPNQIKLSTGASNQESAYNGWLVESGGETQKIISYIGSLRVATLESSWASQPVETDVYNLYANTHKSVYAHTNGSFRMATVSFDSVAKTIVERDLANVACGDISTGTATVLNLQVNSTQDDSIFTYGGMYIEKDIITRDIFAQSIRADGNISFSSKGSFIDFSEFGIISDNDALKFTWNTQGNSPSSTSATSLMVHHTGISINTTNASADITLRPDAMIQADTLTLSGGGSDIVLMDDGNITVGASGGNITFSTNNLDRVRITDSVIVVSTHASPNSTSGCIQSAGGIGIACTENALSTTQGNALTVAGGAAVRWDLYVGGDLIVDGNISAGGSNTSPLITFSNTTNCSVSDYGNSQMITVGSEQILSFYVEILPISDAENTQFQFDIPSRTTNLTSRGDIIMSCSGWTDDADTVLFNILGTGVPGTTRAMVKFQSANTNTHTVQIMARFTND